MVDTATTANFTLTLSPLTVAVAGGKSGTVKIKTTVVSGYDHLINLSKSNMPAGVTIKLSPATIPAPGAGTSTATITVAKTVAVGSYAIHVRATDGTNSVTKTFTLKVTSTSDPGATFQGCWYTTGGSGYQGVRVSVKNPGTYPFYANLYYGATCSQWADDFGNGQEIPFGNFDYIFWFDHFPNQRNMSALWQVGADKSVCVSYATIPDC